MLSVRIEEGSICFGFYRHMMDESVLMRFFGYFRRFTAIISSYFIQETRGFL